MTTTQRITRAALEQAAAEAEVWPPILAVDPGSGHTGVCLRVGREALEALSVEFGSDPQDACAATDYAGQVLAVAGEIAQRHEAEILGMAHERGLSRVPLRRAVEVMVPPTPAATAKGRRVAVAPRVLASLPVACTVLGAVFGRWPRVIRVPPRGGLEGGWEALPGDPYPESLRGRTPDGWLRGGSDRSHQRSAWAVAGAAHALDLAAQTPSAEAVQAVVLAVLAAKPDPRDPAGVLGAIRAAISSTRSGSLIGREAAIAAAAARGLGVEPQALRTAVLGLLSIEGEAA